MTKKETERTEKFTFQAEVAQVMDIVIHSLYTDKEIFIRELISNSADALEKIRHLQLVEPAVQNKDAALEIRIDLDETKKTFTITDSGLGMTRQELIDNLGNVAHSGAKDFISKLAENVRKDIRLIGQFGVGFYSAFMVSKTVNVQSRSWQPDEEGYEWRSDGPEGYVLTPVEGLPRGTKIVLEMKDNPADAEEGQRYDEFVKEWTVQRIIKQYSNFVPFPILLNGKKINTIEAIWTRNKNDIKPEEYAEFYKFVANAFDEPLATLHFSADAPLALNALLFVPKENYERMGIGKMETNVDLHCRKVMIQKAAKELLPPWLRFLRGVVDSEDIPLNISRETMQDSALIRKLNKAVTKRFLKFLDDMSSTESDKYATFWKTFGIFIKEGLISDYDHRPDLTNLIRFESSKSAASELTSLKDYASRMKPDQKGIYYLNGSSRESLEAAPYLEVFRKNDIEVLFHYEAVDDFVVNHLREYEGKKFISADSESLELPESATDIGQDEAKESIARNEIQNFSDWIKSLLIDRIKDVRESKRLLTSPAALVNPEGEMTPAMQRLMLAMSPSAHELSKRTMEFNPQHPIMVNLNRLRTQNPDQAHLILEQIFDQAGILAGLQIDARKMVERMYKILEFTLGK